MNCKPGDMAMVVSGEPSINLGRVIRVTRIAPVSLLLGLVCWEYEGELIGLWGIPILSCADDCLRPLRDQDGPDESLSWVTVPATPITEKVTS